MCLAPDRSELYGAGPGTGNKVLGHGHHDDLDLVEWHCLMGWRDPCSQLPCWPGELCMYGGSTTTQEAGCCLLGLLVCSFLHCLAYLCPCLALHTKHNALPCLVSLDRQASDHYAARGFALLSMLLACLLLLPAVCSLGWPSRPITRSLRSQKEWERAAETVVMEWCSRRVAGG